MLGLFAVSLGLRPQIIAIGPLLPEMRVDLGISAGVAGLLGTIPVLCMGLFAPLAPAVLRWWGTARAVGVGLAGLGLLGLARAFAPEPVTLLVLTVGVGVGIAVIGALLPVAVKQRTPRRPAVATGVYTSGIQVGATVAALTAVPIASWAGGWRATLGAFSLATLVIAVGWRLSHPVREPPGSAPVELSRLPFGSLLVWGLAGVFGLQSVVFYGLNAWLPAYLVEHGWSAAEAGAALGLTNGCGLLGTLIVPRFVDRVGSRRIYLTAGSAVLGLALTAMLSDPAAAWRWVPLIGLAMGSLFALSLTLPLDVARDPREVGAIVSLVLGVGYVLSALAPAGLGVIHDLTGTFSASLAVLVSATIVLALLALPMDAARLARGA